MKPLPFTAPTPEGDKWDGWVVEPTGDDAKDYATG